MTFSFRTKPVPSVEDEDEVEDEFLDTDEGASVWLESIGLDKKQFPSLDPNKVKMYPSYPKTLSGKFLTTDILNVFFGSMTKLHENFLLFMCFILILLKTFSF